MTADVMRDGEVTFRGRPVTLAGGEVKVGGPAPEFTVLGSDFSPLGLDFAPGAVRILSAVPSLDTEVCDQQTRRFHEEAAALDGVAALAVSVDLPFAQARWCGASGLDRVWTASDHRDLSFGLAYGVVVAQLRLLARAVFVVDPADQLVHVEYVAEIGAHPDYEQALAVARSTLNR